MHACIQISQPFKLPSLLVRSLPFDQWQNNLSLDLQFKDWRCLDLKAWDDEDTADFGFPLWEAFPYNVVYYHDHILFCHRSSQTHEELNDLFELAAALLKDHQITLSRIDVVQYCIGWGLGSVDISFVIDNCDPALIDIALMKRLDKFRNDELYEWYKTFPYNRFQQAGSIQDEALRQLGHDEFVADAYAFGLIVRADADELRREQAHLLSCAKRVAGSSSDLRIHANLDPDLQIYAAGMGQYFASTSDFTAEVRIRFLWSAAVLFWDAIGDLDSPSARIADLRTGLQTNSAPQQLEQQLNSLALTEQRFIGLRGLADPARLQANEFEKNIYTPIWENGGAPELLAIAASEMQALTQLIQARLAQIDQAGTRRLNMGLFVLGTVGLLQLIGDWTERLAKLWTWSAPHEVHINLGLTVLVLAVVAGCMRWMFKRS